jgi:hypothetical protein
MRWRPANAAFTKTIRRVHGNLRHYVPTRTRLRCRAGLPEWFNVAAGHHAGTVARVHGVNDMTDPGEEYDRIRIRLTEALKRDSVLHESRRYEELGRDFLKFESRLRQGGDHRFEKLIVALRFWDAWILARNTDWLEHDHIPERLWGTLAKAVAADLDADRDVSDPRVRASFDLSTTLELPKRSGPKRDAGPLDQTNYRISED